MREFASLADLAAKIRTENAAIAHFRAILWRNGAFCPYCGATKIYDFSDGRTHKCGECRQRFSIKVGTIFEDTKLPLNYHWPNDVPQNLRWPTIERAIDVTEQFVRMRAAISRPSP